MGLCTVLRRVVACASVDISTRVDADYGPHQD